MPRIHASDFDDLWRAARTEPDTGMIESFRNRVFFAKTQAFAVRHYLGTGQLIFRDVKRDLLKKAREAGKRETVYSTKQGILGQYSSTKNSRNLFYFSDDEVVAAPLARFAYNNDIPAFKLFLEFTQKLMQDLGDAFIIKLECGHAAGFFSAAPEQFKLSIRRKES